MNDLKYELKERLEGLMYAIDSLNKRLDRDDADWSSVAIRLTPHAANVDWITGQLLAAQQRECGAR